MKIYHAERQLQWVLDGNRGGWTCPTYEPENAKRLVYAPPDGDATEMLQKMFDDRMKVTVRLGPGDWHVGPLTIAQTGFKLELKDGCRLVGRPGAFKPGEGILNLDKGTIFNRVTGEGKVELVMPEGCAQPAVRLVSAGHTTLKGLTTVGCGATGIDRGKTTDAVVENCTNR